MPSASSSNGSTPARHEPQHSHAHGQPHIALRLALLGLIFAGALFGTLQLLHAAESIPGWMVASLEAAMLTSVAVPAAYLLVLRPLVRVLRDRTHHLSAQLEAWNCTAIVAVTDANGRILHVNDLFCRVSGYAREELLGRTHDILNSAHHERKFFMDMYRTISTGQPWRGEICNRAKDGSLFWVDTTIVPTIDVAGRVTQYTSIHIDITSRKNAEELLAQLRERHTLAIAASGICLWDWDLVQDTTEVTQQWFHLFGHAPEDMTPAIHLWQRHMHADDYDALRKQLDLYCLTQAPLFACQVRIRHQLGHWTWVLMRGCIVRRDANGLPLRLSGTCVDISALKQVEADSVKARNAAESASQAKSDFLATMSHELRAPLDLMLGCTEQLLDSPLAENQLGLTQTIRDSGRSLSRIIDHAARANGPRVLLVEDDTANRRLASRLLSKLGCTVEVAENGRGACERSERQDYDLIFMDCKMPEIDGFEATRKIRAREAGTGAHTPIVALTGSVMPHDRDRCFEAGMDDFVAKPYSAIDFERTLVRWCGLQPRFTGVQSANDATGQSRQPSMAVAGATGQTYRMR